MADDAVAYPFHALSVRGSMLAEAATKANGQACIEAVLSGFVPQPQPTINHQQAIMRIAVAAVVYIQKLSQ